MMETVFSVSLIGVVILLVFNLFPSSSLAVHRSKLTLQANTVAQSLLEQARSLGIEALSLDTPYQTDVALEGVDFHATREAYRVDTYDPDQIRGVRVSVRWRESNFDHLAVQEAYVTNLPR